MLISINIDKAIQIYFLIRNDEQEFLFELYLMNYISRSYICI